MPNGAKRTRCPACAVLPTRAAQVSDNTTDKSGPINNALRWQGAEIVHACERNILIASTCGHHNDWHARRLLIFRRCEDSLADCNLEVAKIL